MDESGIRHSDILSVQEIRRYIQQIKLPCIQIEGQEKIKNSKVLIVGIGSIGVSVLQHLIALGVGTIGLCDNCVVTDSNLSAQNLYGDNDLGKHKAIISKEKLEEINHFINYRIHNVFLSEKNAMFLSKDYDLLIDATDNPSIHPVINNTALKLNIPFIFCAVENACGKVTVFNYKNSPRFQYLLNNTPEIKPKPEPGSMISKISLVSVLGSIIANETLKIMLGMETQLNGFILTYDSTNYAISITKINRSS